MKLIFKEKYLSIDNFKDVDLPDFVSRIFDRVKKVDILLQKKQYVEGILLALKIFSTCIQPIADSWQIYDNSDENNLMLIASKVKNQLHVQNETTWSILLETYHEKRR